MPLKKPSTTTPFSLTYGEETKLPLTVKAAAFHVTSATSQRLALVEARLTVCNDAIHKDIEATLRFPLPDSDATVCGFSVGPNRAISVPKAKAAEVAYKEREKGRAVATAANVSGATWETTVYPLPHNIPVEVTIQVVCGLSEDGAVALPLTFAAPVERIDVHAVAEDGAVGTDNLGGGVTNSTMPEGLRVAFAPASAEGRVVSAMRDGSLFWSCCVPKEAIDRAFAEQPQQAAEEQQAAGAPVVGGGGDVHVGVVVDVSRSCAPMAEARLACLVCRSGAQTHPGGAGARATCYSRVRALCWDRTRWLPPLPPRAAAPSSRCGVSRAKSSAWASRGWTRTLRAPRSRRRGTTAALTCRC